MKIKPTLELKRFPRMADFELWSEAIARAIGTKTWEFIRIYYDNMGKQNVEAIESNALGQAMAKFVSSWCSEETQSSWQGPMSKALEELNRIAYEHNIDTSSRACLKPLTRLAGN